MRCEEFADIQSDSNHSGAFLSSFWLVDAMASFPGGEDCFYYRSPHFLTICFFEVRSNKGKWLSRPRNHLDLGTYRQSDRRGVRLFLVRAHHLYFHMHKIAYR